MNFSDRIFKNDEKALYQLRKLYQEHGYARYKVSKFEEYDLYAHNKRFLISENILTFTDTNGKLMALKPDVTLSIVKNLSGEADTTHKLYYNETVYRTSASSDGFREIMQTGLECIGAIDLFATCEVLMLAEKSLSLIAKDYILDLSHMGFLTGLLETAEIAPEDRGALLAEIGNKNTTAIRSYCAKRGISREKSEILCKLTALYAPLSTALEEIRPYVRGEKMQAAYDELCGISETLCRLGVTNRIYLDLSMVQDMHYYNGVIFRGFLSGLPDGILSGGRYDSLLQKMGKPAGAIGFAVYLDQLMLLPSESAPYDVDVLLTYDKDSTPEQIMKAVSRLRADGKLVRVSATPDTAIRAKETIYLGKEGLL